MYIIFSGTTDYYPQLLHFLATKLKYGYSLFEGKGGWKNKNLSAQMIVFFDYMDAVATQKFLEKKCSQKNVEVLKLDTPICKASINEV